MSKTKQRGRPIGGDAHPELRRYWREAKRKQRAHEKEMKKK